jgi:hypothetical protein
MNGDAGAMKSLNAANVRFAVQLDNGRQPYMLKAATLDRL